MEELRNRFESLQKQLEPIEEKLRRGIFLTEQDFSAVRDALEDLRQEQERMERLLAEEQAEDEGPRSMEQVERLLRRRREREARRMQTAMEFASIRTLDDGFRADLERFQKELAAQGATGLEAMDRAGTLEPYRLFVACVQMEEPAYDNVAPLTATFGYSLPFGILGKKFCLTTGTPDVEVPFEPETPVVPAASVPLEEPELPGPPLTDMETLGVLNQQTGSKKPKGTKALKSLCAASPQRMLYIVIIMSEIIGHYLIVPTSMDYLKSEKLDPEMLDKHLELMLKEGYLIRYTLDTMPGKKIYGATALGEQIFRKSPLLRIADVPEREIPSRKMNGAADFIRRYEGRRWFCNMFWDEEREKQIFAYYFEGAISSMVAVRETEESELLCLILPTVILTPDDTEEDLEELQKAIRKEVADSSPELRVFLATRSPEEFEGWSAWIRPQLPEGTEILRGTVGESDFIASDGSVCVLDVYIRQLMDCLQDQDQDEKAPEEREEEPDVPPVPEHVHRPGKPVLENIEQASCACDGRCEAVICCTVCGEELSREARVLPAKGHDAGKAVRENETPPTCTQEGSYDEVVRCKVCGEELSRVTKTLPAKGHVPGKAARENVTDPTCTEEGSCEEVIRCKVCGEELGRETKTLPALGHDAGPAVQISETEPTCTREGSCEEAVFCTRCQAELSRQVRTLEPLGHLPGEVLRENVIEPTETEEGSYDEVVFCARCHAQMGRTIKLISSKELTAGSSAANMRQEMYGMFVNGQFPSALTLSRILARESKELRAEYQRFAYAMDDPAIEKNYCCSNIQAVFADVFGRDPAYDALGLASYLHMFFSSDALMESYYIDDSMNILDQNLMFRSIPELKTVLYDLTGCFTRTRAVFDPETLSALLDNRRNDSLRDQYQKEAARFLSSRPEETQKRNQRINATYKRLFGPKSELRNAIEWTQEGDDSKTEEIVTTLKGFLKEDVVLTGVCEDRHLDRESIERYVTEAWNAVEDRAVRNRNDKFKDPANSTAVTRVEQLVKIALSWATLGSGGEENGLDEDKQSYLDTRRKKIASEMEEAATRCVVCPAKSAEEKAANSVLAAALNKLSGWLLHGCDPDVRRYFYLEFLRDNRIEMDENYIPFLEERFSAIQRLNIGKRVIKHSQDGQLPEWPEVIKRIFEEAEEGCDFGHAELIKNYLLATGAHYEIGRAHV